VSTHIILLSARVYSDVEECYSITEARVYSDAEECYKEHKDHASNMSRQCVMRNLSPCDALEPRSRRS
jgi:hypothetical protein